MNFNCWLYFFAGYGVFAFARTTWEMLSARRHGRVLLANLRNARRDLEAFASEESPFPQTYCRPLGEDRRDAR
jgi:hypothetical protein